MGIYGDAGQLAIANMKEGRNARMVNSLMQGLGMGQRAYEFYRDQAAREASRRANESLQRDWMDISQNRQFMDAADRGMLLDEMPETFRNRAEETKRLMDEAREREEVERQLHVTREHQEYLRRKQEAELRMEQLRQAIERGDITLDMLNMAPEERGRRAGAETAAAKSEIARAAKERLRDQAGLFRRVLAVLLGDQLLDPSKTPLIRPPTEEQIRMRELTGPGGMSEEAAARLVYGGISPKEPASAGGGLTEEAALKMAAQLLEEQFASEALFAQEVNSDDDPDNDIDLSPKARVSAIRDLADQLMQSGGQIPMPGGNRGGAPGGPESSRVPTVGGSPAPAAPQVPEPPAPDAPEPQVPQGPQIRNAETDPSRYEHLVVGLYEKLSDAIAQHGPEVASQLPDETKAYLLRSYIYRPDEDKAAVLDALGILDEAER